MNYFELYGIPQTFTPDQQLVKRKFYELSKKYHPDFYINESEEKQAEILELSTLNNKAWQVLSDPLKRIPYILEQHGLIEANEKYQLPQSFLMEMMEVNEGLMELEMDFDTGALESITHQVNEAETALFDELKVYTDSFDNNGSADKKAILLKIKDIWYRQKYLLRIRDTLNKFASRS